VFGGRGATDFITRATVVLGRAVFVTSLSLALMTTRGTTTARSVVSEAAKRASDHRSAHASERWRAPGGKRQVARRHPHRAPAAPATPPPNKK
jgi:hypothetical protein